MTITLFQNFFAVLYAPFYAAHLLGAYDAEGVDVRLETAPSAAQSALGVIEGTHEVSFGGPRQVIEHYAEDPSCGLVAFCEVIRRDPFHIVGRWPKPEFRFEDLEGLRLAVVSEVPTPWVCLSHDLREHGVDIAAIGIVSDTTMEDAAAMLREGAVDAVHTFEPYTQRLLDGGHGHLWRALSVRGSTAYTSFYARRETLAARRAELAGMTRAMYRVMKWLRGRPSAEIARTVSPCFRHIEPDVLTASIARYAASGIWAGTPVLDRDGFEWLRRAAAAATGRQEILSVAYEDVVDTTLAEQAVRDAPPALTSG